MDIYSSFFSNFPLVPIVLTLVVLVYWIHAFFIMYHLMRFGIGTRPKLLALVFFIGSMFLFMTAILFYNQVDLSQLSLNFDWAKNPAFNFPTPTF